MLITTYIKGISFPIQVSAGIYSWIRSANGRRSGLYVKVAIVIVFKNWVAVFNAGRELYKRAKVGARFKQAVIKIYPCCCACGRIAEHLTVQAAVYNTIVKRCI